MGGPYHLILLAITAISGYLLTLALVKTGVITRLLHRRVWNMVLLIAFLISGILGILLVIRMNFRLEWEFMKPLLVWHVDAGIVLTLVAAFHVIWNSSFFIRIFSKPKLSHQAAAQSDLTSPEPGKLTWLILTLGFYSTAVQVLLIREITTVFQGNELMMGWTMGIWMFLTGGGAWLGRSPKPAGSHGRVSKLFVLLAYLPPLLAVGMAAAKNLIFPSGELVNPLWFFVLTLFILAPVSLLTGYCYALLVSASGMGEKGFIRVYSLESLGSIAGGIMVSFLLIRWFSVIHSLLVTAFLMHIVILLSRRSLPVLWSSLLLVSAIILFFIFPADILIKSLLFPHQQIAATHETPSGNITVCVNGGEYSFYENGSLLFSSGDPVISEEYVHYAMLQHPRPEKVLLVSGGIAGMAGEILKFPDVRKIDLVELNPDLIRLARPYLSLPEDDRITLTGGDGRRFIQRTGHTWDVAIFAVPDPSSLQFNRYYTTEFLAVLKTKLHDHAVVLFAISPSGNYLSPEATILSASIYHTLKGHFKNVTVIPGERDYYVASDAPVTEQIGNLAAQKNIAAIYVKPDYLDDTSVSIRSQAIREKIEKVTISNSDRKPLPVFYHTLRFISRFTGRNFYIMIIPLLLLACPLFLLNRISAGMYITGVTASSVELLLIFWFQTVFGNVYSALGLIFAIFMGGLALGSLVANKVRTSGKHQVTGLALMTGYLVLLTLIWEPGFSRLSDVTTWIVFIPVLLIPSLLTGFLYVASTFRYHTDTTLSASSVYAADLWGSALGVILVTIILTPLFGVQTSCLILAALNGLAALFLWATKK